MSNTQTLAAIASEAQASAQASPARSRDSAYEGVTDWVDVDGGHGRTRVARQPSTRVLYVEHDKQNGRAPSRVQLASILALGFTAPAPEAAPEKKTPAKK